MVGVKFGLIFQNNHNSDTEYKTLEAFPFNLPRAGYFTSSASGAFQNGAGYWWSATANSDATNAYHLHFYTTYVTPQDYSGDKHYGFTIRCVAL